MPASSADLLAYLAALGIETRTHEHPPLFTVADGKALRVTMPGVHSKNLFLKDKKGRLFLVVASQDSTIDLKRLHDVIGGSGRLSFGSAELLLDILGVTPGSVTPFALINDRAGRVTLVLDALIDAAALANFHPLINTATTAIARDDLIAFAAATGHPPLVVDFGAPGRTGDL